jgi:co-chaperonin GroES (HSP10)
MKPVRDNVLVRPCASDETTEGGIFIPESCRKPSNKVMIVEVGGGTSKKPMRLQKGATGFRVKDWGEEIIIDGERHFLMSQDAIIALQ